MEGLLSYKTIVEDLENKYKKESEIISTKIDELGMQLNSEDKDQVEIGKLREDIRVSKGHKLLISKAISALKILEMSCE